MTLLRIDGLSLAIHDYPILHDVSLTVAPGQIVGVIGESGSGKSMTSLAVMQLLPEGARATGRVLLDGQDVLHLSEPELCRMRGRVMGMVFQEPMTALNPIQTIGDQVAETILVHEKVSKAEARERARQALARVELPEDRFPLTRYPHELSGGQRQRVVIAMAIALRPKLLIADEPTTALDVTVQAQILQLLKAEQARRNFAILLITHDLTVVQAFADRIAVMYAGRIVEEGPAAQIMADPQHPYTRALIRCSLLEPEADGRLLSIPGSGATARDIACGCRYAPRCHVVQGDTHLHHRCCGAEPGLIGLGTDHAVRCHASQTQASAA